MEKGAILEVFDQAQPSILWADFDCEIYCATLRPRDLLVFLGEAKKHGNVTYIFVLSEFGLGWFARWRTKELRLEQDF